MSHLDMKVKPFNWTAYLRPFFYKELVNELRDGLETVRGVDFLVFLAAVYCEFGVGQKVDREQALKLYRASSLGCSLSAYRLAEIYSEPLHFASLVQADFQLSWVFLLLASAQTFLVDPMNAKESIRKLIHFADKDLENSKVILQGFFERAEQEQSQPTDNHKMTSTSFGGGGGMRSASPSPLTPPPPASFAQEFKQGSQSSSSSLDRASTIINLVKLANLNDKLEEKRCFERLLSDSSGSFPQLFYLAISHHGQENPALRGVLRFLAAQKQQQLKFLLDLQKVFDMAFARLPADHELFQSFRYAVFEFFHVRILSRKLPPGEETDANALDDKIDSLLLGILRNFFEASRHKMQDVTDQTFIIRFYAELLQKRTGDQGRVLQVQREEFNQQIEPVFFAYAHYRCAQILSKMRTERKAATEELHKAEQLFLERFARPVVQDKFLGAYFLGRVYMKLASLEETQNDISQILDQSSVSPQAPISPRPLAKLSASTIVNVPQKAAEYFTKALQLYRQRQVEFQSMRTFQFEVLMIKLEKRMQTSEELLVPPSNNFFSINTIRQTQLKSNVSLSQSRISSQLQQIPASSIQLKSLIRKGPSQQLHSAFVKFQKGEPVTPCLVKILSGMSKMQCETLLKELEKWQGVSNLNHFTGVARKSLNTDFEEVYLVQDTQKSNLLQAVGQQMNLGQKLNIAEQVAMILADIHSKGLVHGNLKPTNVLFSEERVLVSDYCWPQVVKDELEELDEVYGYQEPDGPLDQEQDIWAFGVLLLQIFSQQVLTEKLLQQAQLFDGSLRRMPWLEQAGLKRVCDLVNRMLVLPERKKRVSAQKVLQEIRSWRQQQK